MTPKEKAIELVAKYYQEFIKDYTVLACFSDEIRNSIYNKRETFAKKCALIAVNEILKLHKKLPLETLEHYEQVKNEIENI